ncbi:MAG: hypothetical protein Rsou_0504 [Candidatus Ruthia sp. Asou_11_S2]|nr:hypothetical protein [Candidatus Ruthia sp. Asou_11_S2]
MAKIKAALQEKLLDPNNWVYLSGVMSVVLAIAWLAYTLDANYDKLNKLEKRIQSVKIQKQGANQSIQSWQKKKLLPLLEGRLEYAQLYFGLYDLNLTIKDKTSNGIYQNVIINGKLANVLLAVHDLDTIKLPIEYKNIAIEDEVAALHLVILGRDNE